MSIQPAETWTSRVARYAIWVVLFTAWEIAWRTIQWPAWKFPAPSHVVDAFAYLLGLSTNLSGSVATHPQGGFWSSAMLTALWVSLTRLVAGFAIALVLGVLLGGAIWRWIWLNRLLGPLLLGLQTLPSVCWVPLAVITLKLTESAVIAVMVLGSGFAVALAMRDGLAVMPPLYERAGRMLGATGWRLWRYVLLPASLPAMTGALRQGFGFAWRSLLGAEMVLVTTGKGLGYLLLAGRELGLAADVVAVMAMMVVVGMSVDRWVLGPLDARVRQRFGLR